MDVFIDLRKNSKTYGMFEALKLSSKNNLGILIPEGFGHGYSVLSDSATVLYCQSGNYDADLESGINPLSIEVDWGIENPIISEKDKSYKNFDDTDREFLI
jgi:dTDP-4-dehydrorhamnose 3,5-epimerase